MNILISNDDGITAPGLKMLAEALCSTGRYRLFICAPDRHRSCSGHALTMRDQIITEDKKDLFPDDAVIWAKSCSGTPADCVRIALYELGTRGIKIDMVCSGINNGLNAGSDINYSGTIAVAREASIDGYPAAAFSCAHNIEYIGNFMKIVPYIMERFEGKIPAGMVLNVNAPNVPWDEIKGYRAASLSHIYYPPKYVVSGIFGKRTAYDFASFERTLAEGKEDDARLLSENYITVSLIPLLQRAEDTIGTVQGLL